MENPVIKLPWVDPNELVAPGVSINLANPEIPLFSFEKPKVRAMEINGQAVGFLLKTSH